MQGLPFEIPQSLSTYLTQFENDPGRGIANLETFLKKRGMDAVGFFLLSWLYHKNDQKEEAMHYAFKAKCCAPGSPFFQHLHYFLMHPDQFKAWKPSVSESEFEPEPEVEPIIEPEPELEPEPDVEPEPELEPEPGSESRSEPETASGDSLIEEKTSQETENALNLDLMIEKLSYAENNRITIVPDPEDNRNLGEKSEKVGDIASETLARIYEKQKKFSDALRTFNKLKQSRPHKADFYQQEIDRIRSEMNQTN